MQVNTISLIEQFMADALLSSEVVPLGVNVVRLAATQDEEGIARMARSIVIRYVGSSTNVLKKIPLTIERTMTFQVIISAQSYLSESGHDYALQMCAGSYLTLNNGVPTNRGLEITQPFMMTNESFDGLTDSSHYVYIQNWELVITELNPYVALDPCVQRGNCQALFPSNIAEEILPGDVIYNSKIYVPVLPPPAGSDADYESVYAGVIVEGDNLVFEADPGHLFLAFWKDYKLVSTGTFDESGQFLICNVRTIDTDEYVDRFYAFNRDDRAAFSIGASGDLTGSETQRHVKTKSDYGYTNVWPFTTIYLNPTEEEGATQEMKYGSVLPAEIGTTLRIFDDDGVEQEYYKVNGSTFGSGWIKIEEITIFVPSRTDININCDGPDTINDGPQTCE